MSAPAATSVLRPGVLAGRSVAVTAPGGACAGRAGALGARIVSLGPDLGDEDALAAAVAAAGGIDALVVDAGAAFRAAGGGGIAALRAAVDGAFAATRAVATGALIAAPGAPAGHHPAPAGGPVVLIAPRPGDGEHAGATRAALENTARTLSVEWARFAVTPTAMLPGDATADEEIAEVAAFLLSGAGAYYTGCALTLGQVSSP